MLIKKLNINLALGSSMRIVFCFSLSPCSLVRGPVFFVQITLVMHHKDHKWCLNEIWSACLQVCTSAGDDTALTAAIFELQILDILV